MNEQFIGLLMAANGLIIVGIEMILVFSLEGRRPLMTYIRIGVFLMGVSFAAINLLPAGTATAVVAIIIITLGEILSMPFYEFLLGKPHPPQQPRAIRSYVQHCVEHCADCCANHWQRAGQCGMATRWYGGC